MHLSPNIGPKHPDAQHVKAIMECYPVLLQGCEDVGECLYLLTRFMHNHQPLFLSGLGRGGSSIFSGIHSLPVRKEERWKVYDRARGACICPSYTLCSQGNGEVLFCILGTSFRCIREDKGCTCPKCPVYQELGLSKKDFCMKGSEKDQRWEKGLG
jgi:hypothetical protein